MNKEFMIPVQIQQLIEDDGKHFFVQKKYKVQELSETSLNNFIEGRFFFFLFFLEINLTFSLLV